MSVPTQICQSFAKNFGLYGERVGTVSFVANDAAKVPQILSQLDVLIRTVYSNPPLHGARIVQKVLEDPALTQVGRADFVCVYVCAVLLLLQ